MSICPRQMVSFCPLGGRDGFAFGEPLRRRCPWTDNNVIQRKVLFFIGGGPEDFVYSQEPALRVPSKGF